jgi:hypothetical protein
MATNVLSEEWQDIVDRTFDLLSDYTSKFDHISEITLTWVRQPMENAPLAEARIITVEEQSEPVSSRNSGFSVKIVGIGTMESNQKYEQMGFAIPKGRKGSSDVEQGPVDEGRMRNRRPRKAKADG